MAAILCVTLWFTLASGHPLHHGSTSLLALAFSSLCVLYLAALPQRPGAPSARPEQAVAFVWMPWLVAVIPLSLVFSETGLLPWLWPLLLLPLTALFLAFLATRAHRRPVPGAPRGYSTAASQSFCTAVVAAALVSFLLYSILTNGSINQSRPFFVLMLFALVAVLVGQILVVIAPALPGRFAGTPRPPVVSVVFVWLAWPMALVAALPAALNLIHPLGVPSLWPLALFPLGATGFAVLSTRAYLWERAELGKGTDK